MYQPPLRRMRRFRSIHGVLLVVAVLLLVLYVKQTSLLRRSAASSAGSAPLRNAPPVIPIADAPVVTPGAERMTQPRLPTPGGAVDAEICAVGFGTDLRAWRPQFEFCAPIKGVSGKASRFHCWENTVLKSVVCQADWLLMSRALIACAAGGERIEDVMGRQESDEFPAYSSGAFKLSGCELQNLSPFLGREREFFVHHLGRVASALESTPGDACSGADFVEERSALLVTRYEYANLYHVSTDWYNVYQALHFVQQTVGRPPELLVWMDGRAQTPLDAAWTFGLPIVRLSELPEKTCFRHAFFLPPGYRSAFDWDIDKTSRCGAMKNVRMFAELMLFNAFGGGEPTDPRPLSNPEAEVLPLAPDPSRPRITVILRGNYLAHPRNPSGKAERTSGDPKPVVEGLRRAGPWNVRAIYFALIPFREQLAVIRNTDILVGTHGAGLSMVLFLPDSSAMVECQARDSFHFVNYCQWRGLACCKQVFGNGLTSTELHKAVAEASAALRPHHAEWT